MDAKLVVVSGSAQAGEYALKLPTIVGRSRSAGLKLIHPLVSRQHCEIFESEGVLKVRDLGSLNGTFIGEERITDDEVLEPDGLLTIGSVTFRVVYGTRAAAAAAAGEHADEGPAFAFEEEAPAAGDPGIQTVGQLQDGEPGAPSAEEPSDQPAFDFGWLDEDAAAEPAAPLAASAAKPAKPQHAEEEEEEENPADLIPPSEPLVSRDAGEPAAKKPAAKPPPLKAAAKAKPHESETQPYEPHSAARSVAAKPAAGDAARHENLAAMEIAASSEHAAGAVDADAIDELAVVEGFDIIEETPAGKPGTVPAPAAKTKAEPPKADQTRSAKPDEKKPDKKSTPSGQDVDLDFTPPTPEAGKSGKGDEDFGQFLDFLK